MDFDLPSDVENDEWQLADPKPCRELTDDDDLENGESGAPCSSQLELPSEPEMLKEFVGECGAQCRAQPDIDLPDDDDPEELVRESGTQRRAPQPELALPNDDEILKESYFVKEGGAQNSAQPDAVNPSIELPDDVDDFELRLQLGPSPPVLNGGSTASMG